MHLMIKVPDERASHFRNLLAAQFPEAATREIVVSDDGRTAYVDRVADLFYDNPEMFEDVPAWDDLPRSVQLGVAEHLADLREWQFPEDGPVDIEDVAEFVHGLVQRE